MVSQILKKMHVILKLSIFSDFFLVLCVQDKPAYFAYRLHTAIHVSMPTCFKNFSKNHANFLKGLVLLPLFKL